MATTKKQFWQNHIDQAEQIGLSGQKYCTEHSLSYSAFMYWRSKLRRTTPRKKSFVPVQISPPVQSTMDRASIVVTFPDGTTLRWEG